MARSIDVPVLSVSAAMSVIAVYRNDLKHTVQPTGWLHDRTDQALATMQRFRSRFDVALAGLSMLEVEDTVSVGDVVAVVQAAEMLLRIAEEVEGYLVELGEDGRLVGLQSAELVDGVAPALDLVVRDYCRLPAGQGPATGWPWSTGWSSSWPACPPTSCRTPAGWPRSSACPARSTTPSRASSPAATGCSTACPGSPTPSSSGSSSGSSNLQQIMRASLGELEQVEGVGQARAHSVKDGLARLAEASIFERYQ